MPQNPVSLDFSKAQPIEGTQPSQGQDAGVTLDFSKAQPIAPQQNTAGQEAPDTTPDPDGSMAMSNIQANAPQQSHPGLLDRAWQTGYKGLADLTGGTLKREYDLYTQVIDAMRKGDDAAGRDAARKLLLGPLEKDHPIRKAAEAIVTMPVEEIKAERQAQRDAQAAREQGDTGTATQKSQEAVAHHMKAIPVLGPALASIAEPAAEDVASGGYGDLGTAQGRDELLHNANWSGFAGDFLGPVSTMLLSSLFGKGASAGAADADARAAGQAVAPKKLLPGEIEVADTHIPVTARQMDNPSLASKMLTGPQKQQEFINTKTQPAAVKALQNTFNESMPTTVDQLRAVRGEQPLAASPPVMKSVDDIAKVMKAEAQKSYSVLDKAAETDIRDWEQAKAAFDKATPDPSKAKIAPTVGKDTAASKAVAKESYKAAKAAWEEANPKPKTFTELQDELSNVKRVMNSKSPGLQEARRVAKLEQPGIQQEMDDFMSKYGHLVHPDELRKANAVWAEKVKYEFIADKLRSAISDTTDTSSVLGQQKPMVSPGKLKSLKDQVDNHWNKGTFERLLGPGGYRNYNEIQNALRNPATEGSSLESFLKSRVFPSVKEVPSVLLQSLLFNPEAGQAVLKAWRNTMAAPNAIIKGAPAGMAAEGAQRKRQVYSGADNLAQ